MSENQYKIYSDVQLVEIEMLKPNTYNPNIMTDDAFNSLVEDFKENGFVGQPIIIDDNNEIIDGEHRWRAAKILGFEKVPTVRFNPKDEDHKKILTIAWNSKRGEMSPTKLASIVSELNQKFTLDELSVKLGCSAERLKDTLAITQVTKEFMDKLKQDADEREKELPQAMTFAVYPEQVKRINEALEIAIGKNKGEKLFYICDLYLKQKPENDQA
ncbi:MAG TPA: ParB/RepB/Spo0J family partition protein [Candidatus Moranbacteria bacterium]|nr:ParB/RepB/Spo0J family partition protein [Candidatus Moranbacteria bacterium]